MTNDAPSHLQAIIGPDAMNGYLTSNQHINLT